MNLTEGVVCPLTLTHCMAAEVIPSFVYLSRGCVAIRTSRVKTIHVFVILD
jgi:hypothetical protein